MYKIEKDKLPKLLEAIAKTSDVYAPVRQGEQVNFAKYGEGETLDIDTLKTVKSPKDFFLPQAETLYYGNNQGGKLSIEPASLEHAPFVVFGVRGCDVKAMTILDKVYLTDPIDRFYEARRKQGCIIALACAEPQLTCFCKPFGVDAAEPGADITTWPAGDFLYWKANTEKGHALTKAVESQLDPAADTVAEECKADIRKKVDALPYSQGLPLERFKAENLLELFEDPRWDELYKACLACGTCAFVCPTCQCYDIQDFDTGNGVQRFRCWDSCMYSDFTLMAHGNPRTSQKERFRQRFMHKLVYSMANDGDYSCVGCGRCVNKCPVQLNIVKVIKSLGVGANV